MLISIAQTDIKMKQDNLEKLKYPVGRLQVPKEITSIHIQQGKDQIKTLPNKLRIATSGLSDSQLDQPYREGGWSIRQITHHLADSHINSFTRFKLALTEDRPTIKSYDQDAWVAGSDAKMPIDASLQILDGVHARLSHVLENMSTEEYNRELHHPEMQKNLNLAFITVMYGWHSDHHLHQVKEMRARNGWN